MERNPHIIFYERDLKAQFPTQLQATLDARLLEFVQHEDTGETIRAATGHVLTVARIGERLWGLRRSSADAAYQAGQ